ncbi:hypothetical protein DOY81_013634 [Sarcophaga bullata]|nr:hypothetical protein DOY81_013634 [Sarcophaga bullata]
MSTRRKDVIIPKLLPKQPDHYENRHDRENSFGNSVLVGNWFEDRFAHEEDRKAITPGIYGNSSCINDDSVYHTDFKQPITKYPGDEHEDFKDIMYRILPKEDVNCHVLMPKKEKVNDDYMRSFGNSTRTGPHVQNSSSKNKFISLSKLLFHLTLHQPDHFHHHHHRSYHD